MAVVFCQVVSNWNQPRSCSKKLFSRHNKAYAARPEHAGYKQQAVYETFQGQFPIFYLSKGKRAGGSNKTCSSGTGDRCSGQTQNSLGKNYDCRNSRDE